MIIQDSVQILVTDLLHLGTLWGVLDLKIKGEPSVTLQAAREITVVGGRGGSQADWWQAENAQNKGDFKGSLKHKKGMGLKNAKSPSIWHNMIVCKMMLAFCILHIMSHPLSKQ